METEQMLEKKSNARSGIRTHDTSLLMNNICYVIAVIENDLALSPIRGR